ncbi:hypothetical protein CMO92_05295, partial [Candidatus Woesearchaeota archaeon]|nr:hypothetical protein [Candidatus Woesearchaeota archaeon]
SSNILYPSRSFILDGIHAHHPNFIHYFKNHEFETVKVLLIASFKYLQRFKRKETPPSDEVISRRLREYTDWVYPHSIDSIVQLEVGLDHALIERKNGLQG